MGGVRVVTDSACDLTEELAESGHIAVVPLTIRFGDEQMADRTELTKAEFWRRCRETAALPETSAPSPGAFQAAFEAAADDGADGVLCLTLSSGVSATYQSALAGAEAMRGRFPVTVVDTRSVTMGQGLLCLAGAELAAAGADLDAAAAGVADLVPRTRVMGVLGTLDHLQRGGRIGGAAALVGSLLSVKPVIEVRDGVVEQESRQRTRSRALDYLVAKCRADGPFERIALAGGEADDLDAVAARLADVETAHPILVVDLGPVVATHAGPGTVGVAYQMTERT
jgi:DegV family protein with EDD domain